MMDLILEDIGGIDWVATRIAQARLETRFFKRHGHAREVLEFFSTKTLLLPVETRFGTNVIMTTRLVDLRGKLMQLVGNDRWRETVWSTSTIRKDATEVTACIGSPPWWEDLRALCKMLEPIMDMLKLVDSDTRLISKILRRYEVMIASCLSACRDLDREQQDAILEVFDKRRTMFRTPAHTAAMLLDLEFRDPTLNDDQEVQQGLIETLVQFGYAEGSVQHEEETAPDVVAADVDKEMRRDGTMCVAAQCSLARTLITDGSVPARSTGSHYEHRGSSAAHRVAEGAIARGVEGEHRGHAPPHTHGADSVVHGVAASTALPTVSFYDGVTRDWRAGYEGHASACGLTNVRAGMRSIGRVDGTSHDSMRAYEERHGKPLRSKTTIVHDTRTATARLSRARKKRTGTSIPYHRHRPPPTFRARAPTTQIPATGGAVADGGTAQCRSGRVEKRRGNVVIYHDDNSTAAEAGETTGANDPGHSDYVPRRPVADGDDGGG
ncbi:hypothetical protein CBR_g28765 [Chara braunii]|uniref:Uncharacterized protein n=1 Tax=Chara braunii TaxID=69332 RepID=A0A388L9R8_CHABU|nr:hypothetical protein CBR_g28765 [Chara braunii]|eukprot:GBG79051.1 hypothetical protein CBR_g28765 [Chara braunii]